MFITSFPWKTIGHGHRVHDQLYDIDNFGPCVVNSDAHFFRLVKEL